MTVSLSAGRLLFVFIWLAPLVNNLNGFVMRNFGISAVGPLFYSGFAAFLILALLSFEYPKRDLAINYLILGGLILLFLSHCIVYGIDAFASHVKFYQPILLYRFLQLHFEDGRESISKNLQWSIPIWSAFALFTAVFRIRQAAGEGYYGFIHGNNDYVVMLFALFPLATQWRRYLPLGMFYAALILTRSKGLLLFAPMMLMIPKSRKAKLAMVITAGGILFITTSYYIGVFISIYGRHSNLGAMEMMQFATFGRVTYLVRLFENMGAKSWYEHIAGSGFNGAGVFLEGKVGIEMDLFDAYNIFGLVGLAIVFGFYYRKVIALKNHTWRTKVKFLPVLLYSVAGGHLLFNPISNLVFVLVLFVFEGRVEEGRGGGRGSSKAVFDGRQSNDL